MYVILGRDGSLRGGNVDAVIAIAESLFEDAPAATDTFRYDTYDTTGAVGTPGSYAFLSNPDDTSTVVTTYEALRDGTTTALLIHTTDAEGASRADVYDAVQAGDLFEWHQADDCFVRYTVMEVKPDPTGTVPRKLLAVEWMTYAYTGCSGAVSTSDDVQIVWGDLPNLGGESLRVPVIHGAYEIVPLDWEGETLREYVSFPDYSDPVETDDIVVARTLDFWREPTVPEGWTFDKAIAAAGDSYGGASYGYCATWWATDRTIPEADDYAHAQVGVEICADFTSSRYGNRDASWNDGSAAHETRVIAGRPASLRFSPPGPNHRPGFPTLIEVFDPATGVTYEIEAIDYYLRSNPEAVVEMAVSLFEDGPPAPDATTTFRYDTYDTTGEVSTPGSYAFLADPDDTSTAVTTYEALRDGTTTALLIHTSDADGASRADVYDAVEAGDLFEWHQADNCFVRYLVTEVKPGPTGTVPRKLLAVEWLIFAFTGCYGRIPTDAGVRLIWDELPALGGDSLAAPVVVGVHQLVPRNWTGTVKESEDHWPDDYSDPVHLTNPSTEQLRALDLWREPDLLDGWFVLEVSSGTVIDPSYGFTAWFSPPDGGIGLELIGYFLAYRNSEVDAGLAAEGLVTETRVVAGRPALLLYSPPGDSHDMYHPTTVHIVDRATQTGYTLRVFADDLLDAIELAASLFESPNAP